jgi:hypothetical protein
LIGLKLPPKITDEGMAYAAQLPNLRACLEISL